MILLTDGGPSCGTTPPKDPGKHRLMIRNANAQHATINVFGIGAVGSWRAFCQGVAADSGGMYYDVPK